MAELGKPLESKLIQSEKKEDDMTIAVSILKKNNRSTEDLLFLRKLLKQVEYVDNLLNDLENAAQLDLLREIKLKTYEKEDVVFYKDDLAREFFMLLQGSVFILTKVEQGDPHIKVGMYSNRGAKGSKTIVPVRVAFTSNSESEASSPTKRLTMSPTRKLTMSPTRKTLSPEESPKKTLNLSPIRRTTTAQTMPGAFNGSGSFSEFLERTSTLRKLKHDLVLSEEALLNCYPSHKLITTLYAPNYFGEIALNDSTTRSATIVCREACIMATLHKTVYQRVLVQHYERQNKEKMDFLKSIPMLSSWPLHSISALFRNVNLVKKRRGQTVFKEGDPFTHVYLIKSGEVELSKKIILENNLDNFSKMVSSRFKADFYDMQDFKQVNAIWKNELQRKQKLKIGIVTVGEVLGDLDLLDKNMRREYTAKCYSLELELYQIELKMFITNASQFSEILKTLKTSKKRWRDEFQQQIIECYKSKWAINENRLAQGFKFQELHEQKLKKDAQLTKEIPITLNGGNTAVLENKMKIGFKLERGSDISNLALKGSERRESTLPLNRFRSRSQTSSFLAINSPHEVSQKQPGRKTFRHVEEIVTPNSNSQLEYLDFNFFATKRTSGSEPQASFAPTTTSIKRASTVIKRDSALIEDLPQHEQNDKKNKMNFNATLNSLRLHKLPRNTSAPLLSRDLKLSDFMDKPSTKPDLRMNDSKRALVHPNKPSPCTSLADLVDHSNKKKPIPLILPEHLFLRNSINGSNASTFRDSVISTHRNKAEKEIFISSARNPLHTIFYASKTGMRPSQIIHKKIR